VNERQTLGRAGENAAADLYRAQGFMVLERNYRCPAGEIDLILRRGDLIVFCEVKTRRGEAYGVGAEAVGALKQSRLRRIAAQWLRDRTPGLCTVRFDVVSAMFRRGEMTLELIQDAF
jgi:putative endonuclease